MCIYHLCTTVNICTRIICVQSVLNMNKQSAFSNEESHEKIVKENEEEKRKELKRKRNCERQRAYYHRQKNLKKNEEKKKKKERVPKSNAERQRIFRQRRKRKLEGMKKKAISNELGTVVPHDGDGHSCEVINRSTSSSAPVLGGAFSTQKALEPGPSNGGRESTPASTLHTVYDVPIEEIIIKTEYESDHDEKLDPGEEESVEPKLHHSLVLVESERGGGCDNAHDGSSAGAEDPLVSLTDRLRNDNSIGDASTATAKDLVELLQTLKQGDSFDGFGRYVASSLRSMPARRAQDLQPRIVELLVRGGSGGGGDGH